MSYESSRLCNEGHHDDCTHARCACKCHVKPQFQPTPGNEAQRQSKLYRRLRLEAFRAGMEAAMSYGPAEIGFIPLSQREEYVRSYFGDPVPPQVEAGRNAAEFMRDV